MPDLDLLDSLIAIVVVLLVLSLIVQSIQGALKKLLKIKSRQLEDSLLDLFENTLGTESRGTQGVLDSSPVLRLFCFRKHPATQADPQVQALFQAVNAKFGEIGRVAQSGRVILDSISKEDLLKVIARVAPGTLLPGFAQKLEDACKQVLALEQTLSGIAAAGLSGESAARLASLRQALAPMVNDVRAVFDGQALQPGVLIGDVVRLREVRLDELFAALAELQKGVDREIAEANQAGQSTELLVAASRGLTAVADALAALASKFDAALAPLRTRLRAVETWFDTVMQSFDERYSRGMRTWCFVLSLLVVVVADANFFTVVQTILRNDVQRARIVASGESLLAAEEPAPPAAGAAEEAAPGTEAPGGETPAPTEPASGAALAAAPGRTRILLASLPAAAAAPAPEGTEQPATETPAATEPAAGESTQTVQEIVGEAQGEVNDRFARYTDMGFEPLTWGTFKENFASPRRGAFTLTGWLVMALLLSVGAPFWQDTLESLFGIKNLLRKRGDVQLVEERSGEGHPRAT